MTSKQCPSCGGDCGRTTHCNYAPRLTAQELDAVKAIVAKWDYATEAAIEAYLLGKSCTGVTQHDVRAHVRADIDKLKAALRCGAPSTETWHELASRTNAERSEAADRIEELERKLAEAERRQVPEGWVAVPKEPTETMVIAGFESVPDRLFDGDKYPEEYDAMSGCQKAAFRAKRCYAAMIKAAPEKPE